MSKTRVFVWGFGAMVIVALGFAAAYLAEEVFDLSRGLSLLVAAAVSVLPVGPYSWQFAKRIR